MLVKLHSVNILTSVKKGILVSNNTENLLIMNVLSKFFRYGEEFICFTIALCVLYAKMG